MRSIRLILSSWLCKVSGQNASSPLLRCISKLTFLRKGHLWCPLSDVIYPENTIDILENRPLSSIKGKDPVQVQPQKIRLRLRRGKRKILHAKFLSFMCFISNLPAKYI